MPPWHLRPRLAHRLLRARLQHGRLRLPMEFLVRVVRTGRARRGVGLRGGVVVLDRRLSRSVAAEEGLLLRHRAHDRHLDQLRGNVDAELHLDRDHVGHDVVARRLLPLVRVDDLQLDVIHVRRAEAVLAERRREHLLPLEDELHGVDGDA